MIILFICVSIVIIILFSYKSKFAVNPVTINTACWLIIGFLSYLKLYGYYGISEKTLVIFLLGMIFFAIGFLIKPIHFENKNKKINLKIYEVLLFLANIIMGIFVIRGIKLLLNGYTMSEIRMTFGEVGKGMFYSPVESLLWEYFVRPLLFVAITQLAINLIYKHLNRISFILSILLLIFSLINVSRITLFYILISIAITSYLKIKYENRKINFKFLFKLFILIVFFLWIYQWLSSLRGVKTSLYRNIYEYICSGPIQFEIRIVSLQKNNYGNIYGTAFFAGILQPICLILEHFGIYLFKFWSKYTYLMDYINKFINIKDNAISNAFVTSFFYFYVDFSYFGIIIGYLLYGYISKCFYNNLKENSYLQLSYYLLLIIGIVFSFIRWQFAVTSYLLAFFYLKLIYNLNYEK